MLLDGFIRAAIAPLARQLSKRRLRLGRPRALWGTTPILTLPLQSRATSLLGFESHSLVFQTYFITRDFDYNLRKIANGAAHLGPLAATIVDRLILIWAMLRYDAFHFFFDRGIIRPNDRFGVRTEELDLLKAANKRVYLFAYGGDVRQRSDTLALGKWNFCAECPEPGRFCICDDRVGEDTIGSISLRCTATVACGDMLTYVPNAIHTAYWPIDVKSIERNSAWNTGPLRIVHAPNNTHFKGSHYLEKEIGRLRDLGHPIEYVKLQGLPNRDVMRHFREADLIADQFIGGAYGYTALEGMAHAKPVLTYVRSADLVEAPEECPLLNVTPDTLEETLLWCLMHRHKLAAIGAQGRAYVERWHSIDAVAARLGAIYLQTGNLPASMIDHVTKLMDRVASRRTQIALATDWEHPFRVCATQNRLAQLGQCTPTRNSPSVTGCKGAAPPAPSGEEDITTRGARSAS